MGFRVELPGYVTPIVPDACVRCGRTGAPDNWPGEIPTATLGVMRGPLSRPPPLNPRMCAVCGGRARRIARIQLAATTGALAVVVGSVLLFLGQSPVETRAWAIVAGGAGVLGASVLLRVVVAPSPLSRVMRLETIKYAFANRAYADAFASANHGKVEP